MPSEDFKILQNKISELEKVTADLSRSVSLFKGLPIVRASAGKRFDLNDNLNVIEWRKRFESIESDISSIDTTITSGVVSPVNPSVVNNFVSFSNTTGGQKDSGKSSSSFDLAGAASTVQGNLNTHVGLTGTSVHGLGTASTHAATDFDVSGAASSVQINLNTHICLTGTSVHGLGTAATRSDSYFSLSAHHHYQLWESDDGNVALSINAVGVASFTNDVSAGSGKGFQINGGAGTAGQILVSDGTRFIAGTLSVPSQYLFNGGVIPSVPTSSGFQNQVAYDATYLYVCRASGTWERIPWDTTWSLGDILLETGDYALLEDGFKIVTE